MYKLIPLFFIMMSFFFMTHIGQTNAQMHLSAKSAILMEETSGRVLVEKDAHLKVPIASVTKIMTAIVAIEEGDLNDEVTVSERAVVTEGSSIYLEKNEKMTLEDLLYGLMLRSGNDAAVAIAEHIAGSVEGFVFLMNEKARILGMNETHFMNPHGLDEEGHYSTAYDLALLMKYAMQNDEFRKISKTKSYLSKNRAYPWINKNKLLTNYFEHSTGGKTGYTKRAGRTLVSTASNGNLHLIAVTLNAPNDWNDHRALFEYGFQRYQLFPLAIKGKKHYKINNLTYEGIMKENVFYPLELSEKNYLRKKIVLKETKTSHKEEVIGRVIFTLHNEKIIDVPIYGVIQKETTLSVKLKQLFKRMVKGEEDG